SHLFFLHDTCTTYIYTLSLHDALPICDSFEKRNDLVFMSFKDEKDINIHIGKNYSASTNEKTEVDVSFEAENKLVFIEAKLYSKDRKSTRLNSSHVKISYAVFCLKKKK